MIDDQSNHSELAGKESDWVNCGTGADPKRPKGFLNPRKIKIVSFITISFCIVCSVVVSILAIWDFTKSDALYRSLATLAVIAIGTAIFSVVNEKFGE
jgi:hypothetical protein